MTQDGKPVTKKNAKKSDDKKESKKAA